jgi:hypothetical protein
VPHQARRAAKALGLAARGEYVEAGKGPDHALSALRAINEMHIVVAAQLQSAVRDGAAYPDQAFIDVLVDNARIGRVEHALNWALGQALDRHHAP